MISATHIRPEFGKQLDVEFEVSNNSTTMRFKSGGSVTVITVDVTIDAMRTAIGPAMDDVPDLPERPTNNNGEPMDWSHAAVRIETNFINGNITWACDALHSYSNDPTAFANIVGDMRSNYPALEALYNRIHGPLV
jgi:hypothetical protein